MSDTYSIEPPSDPPVRSMRMVMPGHRWVMNKPRCPYCGGKLTVSVNGWHKENDGWVADDLQLDCENDDEKHEDHSDMPYMNWLPVEQQLLRWMNARYRWKLDGHNTKLRDGATERRRLQPKRNRAVL
jgi:hypothetical protein